MLSCEINISQKEVVDDLVKLFAGCEVNKKYCFPGNDIVQILIPIATMVTALASSKVLVKYIDSKIIKIKVDGIEYEGRAENLPDFLKEKMR